MPRKKKADTTKKLLRDSTGQVDFIEQSYEEEQEARRNQPVTCLGRTFPNDEARREHYLAELAKKLKDPEFRKIEGFPIGEDEDILALSDPPYYTACPNPWIADFIAQWETEKSKQDKDKPYHREPFAADVSEGKNDPIYNAHSYHTKVPHKAIMRYILHYTEPGSIVLDGFCGTGMTAVAAQLCGDKSAVENLGFDVDGGKIKAKDGSTVSRHGVRCAVVNDLSPAATLITAGYNLSRHPSRFAKTADRLLKKFRETHGWMYETTDPKSGDTCVVDFTIWSEMFSCPECSKEIEFWDLAYDEKSGAISDQLSCPHCTADLDKRSLRRAITSYFDPVVRETRKKQVLRPVLIHYKHRGAKKTKKPDKNDFARLEKIEKLVPSLSYPTDLFMFKPEGESWGDLWRGYHEGIGRVHDFHLARQLAAMSVLWSFCGEIASREEQRMWRFLLQSVMVSFTRRNRYRKQAYSQVNTNLSGTLYVGSTISEPSPDYVLAGKIKRFSKAIPTATDKALVSTQSFASMMLPESSVDYVFVDPPFGDNLPYSELNFLWEAWLRVMTATEDEAIVSGKQEKGVNEYTGLMAACLREAYRVLKPGRWVTVEFHNSKNAIWAAIQEALGAAGFIIADVRVLDKGMLTKKQMHANAVNKDLVISAYKPQKGFEERFKLEAGTADGVWDFVRTHLAQLPVSVVQAGQLEAIGERQNFMLFDRMVAYHVQRGVAVPLSASEFYDGLSQKFSERSGMYFLNDQVVDYDKMLSKVDGAEQLELFITDESSAIRWLRAHLIGKPQTYSDVFTTFTKEMAGWQKHERQLELRDILSQNFLCYDGRGEVPPQIHSYLSTNWKELRSRSKDDAELRSKAKDRWYVPDVKKATDLEAMRERSLLREFWEYLPDGHKPQVNIDASGDLPGLVVPQTKIPTGKRMKIIRTEAVRAGFKHCWQSRDYRTIIAVAKRIPEDVLQEDPKLLMWYDQALTRLGEE
jgi:hypothetical protein